MKLSYKLESYIRVFSGYDELKLTPSRLCENNKMRLMYSFLTLEIVPKVVMADGLLKRWLLKSQR